jgi:hypothetical protein
MPRPSSTCARRQRGWEWHYLRGLPANLSRSLAGARLGSRQSLAYNADGTRLAVAAGSPYLKDGGSGEMSIWDARTGRRIRMLPVPPALCDVIAYSPDGKRLASGCRDGTVRVYDAGTGRELRAMPGHRGEIMGLAWSPDGKRIAAGTPPTCCASGSRQPDMPWCRRQDPRSRLFRRLQSGRTALALGCVFHGWLCDAETGLEAADAPASRARRPARTATARRHPRQSRRGLVRHPEGGADAGRTRWQRDGRRHFAGRPSDRHRRGRQHGRLWDASSGTERLVLASRQPRRLPCVSPQRPDPGQRRHQPGDVKVCTDPAARIHDRAVGRAFRFPRGFVPDRREPGGDRQSRLVRVRDVASGTLRQRFAAPMCNDWLVPARSVPSRRTAASWPDGRGSSRRQRLGRQH